jgi:hypothetical protein
MGRLTGKQRDTLLKITLNASNAVLGGLVLGSILGQRFRLLTFLVGLGLYVALIILALRLER